jgi:hypothetical protein
MFFFYFANIQYLLANYLSYVFISIFVLYLIGKTDFLIKLISKIWDCKIYGYNICTFSLLYFTFGVCNNINERRLKINEFNDAIVKMNLPGNDSKFDSIRKTIFLYERGVFLYLTFIVFIIAFIKFADVYNKKFKLEAELREIKNREPVKEAGQKKND